MEYVTELKDQSTTRETKQALGSLGSERRVVTEMNDYQFKLVKYARELVWHDHKDTDEVFLVLSGDMEIEFRDGSVQLVAGDMFVVPKGVEHRTRAAAEWHADRAPRDRQHR